MRSLQGNIRQHQGQGLRFPCNDQTDEVNKYCGLFIMDLSLQSIKTNNWSVDNLKKKTVSCTLEAAIQSGDTGPRMPFLTAIS